MDEPQRSSTILSEACDRYFKGESVPTTPMRSLDVLAYGNAIAARGAAVAEALAAGTT
jgi:hypothetical protein